MRTLILLSVFFSYACNANSLYTGAATAMALAKIIITPSTSTQQVKSLEFTDAHKNAPVTVSTNDDSAAELQVTGHDEYVYRIQLPEDVYLRNRAPATLDTKVKIHSFTASTTSESVCPSTLHIGATRDPLPAFDSDSSFQGAFLVTIIY